MRAYLKTINWIFKLQPKITSVGKHRDSDLCLQNGGVDEHHATIEWNEMEHCYVLNDLNSAHGTYVNDCRIHNATVRLTPGDEIHFGYGGSAYKLIVDPADPLPVLPIHSSTSPARVRSHPLSSSVTPHPPRRPRPASAGAKRCGLGTNTPEYSDSSHRPGSWASNTGRGVIVRNAGMSQNYQSMQDLLRDKEESRVKFREEHSDVQVSQGEAQRKECKISALREEVSALRVQLSQSSQNDPDIRHKLLNLSRDIQEKKEEIQKLKEQMLEIQTRSGELNSQAVAERDQKISNLKIQLDKLKSENSKSAALINNTQKDLLARDKQALNLAAEVDNLRKDARHKDAQLSNMANKLSKLKEIEKHQEDFLAREKEVESLKKTVEQMEMTLREKLKEMKQQNTEKDLLKHRLDQKTQEQSSLQSEMSKLKLQHQQTLQREQKAQSELRHTQTKLENMCSQILKRVLVSSEIVPDHEILDRLSKLKKQKEEINSRVQELEKQLQEHNENQKVVEEDSGKLKTRLAEFQSNIQRVYLVDAIQSQISALQDENVCPAVSWVQTHTLAILTSLHNLLMHTTDTLLATGVEVSEKTGGVSGAVRTLCQQHQEIQSELRKLQADKKQLEERKDQADDMQIKHKTMEQAHQKLQAEETQAKIEDTLQLQLEKISTDLEAARQNEAVLHTEMKMQEVKWRTKLDEAEKREAELKEKVREVELQEEQWRKKIKEAEVKEDEWRRREEEALQRGEEQERERSRVEIEEYREQVRQHAHTIVALEKQMSSALQKAREMQEERDSVTQQLTEALSKMEDVKPTVLVEQPEEQRQLQQTVTSLRSSLGVSQKEVVRQGEVISSLSRDLADAHARLSDLTGELSEQQKMELETHKALVVDQRMQLSMLTQKLTVTTEHLKHKEEELRTLKEKLIQTETDLQRERTENTSLLPLTPHTKDVAIMASPSHLPNQLSKCKRCRQDEMIRQGKETLNVMKERIGAVEQRWPCKVSAQQREPVRQDQKKQVQIKGQRLKTSAAKGESFSSVSGFAFPEALSEAALERTARLDLSDTLELSERTYLDLARALCEALELSVGQLSGCVPLKHLPPSERDHMASLRQEDLELLRSQLALQNSQSQNKDLLLQESQKEIQTLRDSQAVGQQLQIELDNVRSELDTMKLESSTLRQTLEETQAQLQQYSNHRKSTALNMDKMEVRSKRIGHHNCVPDINFGRAAVMKKSRRQERRQRTAGEKDILRNEPKEQESCKMATQIGSMAQQQQSVTLTEAH